jgi:hypothetical protein
MQGQDPRDEILQQSAELRARSAEARSNAARIIAKSRELVIQSDWVRHDVADPSPGYRDPARPVGTALTVSRAPRSDRGRA